MRTLHVPTVEFTLLLEFSVPAFAGAMPRGPMVPALAAMVFQDTLADTLAYLDMGMHWTRPGDGQPWRVADFVRGVPSLGWDWGETDVAAQPWFPAALRNADRWDQPVADDQRASVAALVRVAGAHDLFAFLRDAIHRGQLPDHVGQPLADKCRRFVDAHRPVIEGRSDQVPSLGPTQYPQDADRIRVTDRAVSAADTPLETLRQTGFSDGDAVRRFYYTDTVEMTLAAAAGRIRLHYTDAELEERYTGENPTAVWAYQPLQMASADDCRAHSWVLACLEYISVTWGYLDEAPDEGEPQFEPLPLSQERIAAHVERHRARYDPAADTTASGRRRKKRKRRFLATDRKQHPAEAPVQAYKYPDRVRHALHALLASFAPLLYQVLLHDDGEPVTDEAWRPRPDARPSLLWRYFPHDTVGFHAGDLPNLSALLDHVGMYGVQQSKQRVFLASMMVKSLPVCCQSRDLVHMMSRDCRAGRGEGHWRVVRGLFFCSLAGLYPHCRHRADMRSLIQLHDMLFQRPWRFFEALQKETRDNKALTDPKMRTHHTNQLIMAVFRDYFIHSVGPNHAWTEVVSERIDWDEFAANACYASNEMRRRGRFADAPRGDEFKWAINALVECRAQFDPSVYRFRRSDYTGTILDKINNVQQQLDAELQVKTREADLFRRLLDRYAENSGEDYDSDDDLRLLMKTSHLARFRGRPVTMLAEDRAEFAKQLRRALRETVQTQVHLAYHVDPEVRENIANYLLRCRPEERLQFDCLIDPRLGGVKATSVSTLERTRHIYLTRSSPKSIHAQVVNIDVRDLRIFAWYFEMVERLDLFALVPLDADTAERQARAMRREHFRLMDDEPLPPGAWTVYITFCCMRVCSHSDARARGNHWLSYDPDKHCMVCAKKASRSVKRRSPDEVGPSSLTGDNNRVVIECAGQPAVPIDLRGRALDFNGERYLFCPRCARLDIYSDLGWGQDGYQCRACRDAQHQATTAQCAHCEMPPRPGAPLRPVDFIVLERDPVVDQRCEDTVPADPRRYTAVNGSADLDRSRPLPHALFAPGSDRTTHYQRLMLCQPDANSVGFFAKHDNQRLHVNQPKDDVWPLIGSLNTKRAILQYQKYK